MEAVALRKGVIRKKFLFLEPLLSAVSIGSGGSGGTFAPSLFLGAMAGGVFGNAAHALLPETTASAGAHSLVGMAAVASGTTHGPLSAILILFEMTDNYRIILPLMLACIISFVISSQVMKESIFTLKLVRKGVTIKGGKEVNLLRSIPVLEAMNPTFETIPEGMTLGEPKKAPGHREPQGYHRRLQ